MNRRYETVYIFDSALDEPAITEKLNRFHALLTKDGKGMLANVSHWGKRTMAYRIKKKDTGYYVVAEFEAAGDLLPEYERAVKLDEGVLRYMCVEASREQPKPVPAAVVAPKVAEELAGKEAGEGQPRPVPRGSPARADWTTRTTRPSAAFSPGAGKSLRG